LNEQQQAFAWIVWLGQNRDREKWQLNTGPGGYNNRPSDLQQLSGVAQMRVLHGLMSQHQENVF
jgi:dTDP-4-amino-4,6-dideoxygalactose transaminase